MHSSGLTADAKRWILQTTFAHARRFACIAACMRGGRATIAAHHVAPSQIPSQWRGTTGIDSCETPVECARVGELSHRTCAKSRRDYERQPADDRELSDGHSHAR